MRSSGRLIAAILIVAVLAIGFWMLALGPKREKADELSKEVDGLNVTLVQAQSTVTVAEAAKQAFPDDYRQLVTLGEAVPAADETSSLLVELNEIATDSKVKFESIQLSGSGESAVVEAPEAPPAEAPPPESSTGVPAAATVPPTEAAASLLPLGAAIGPAGLAVMPYNLTFSGNFFQIADFIEGIDSLVKTRSSSVGAEGRLVTIDGFSLNAGVSESGGGALDASFVVTTYVTPPSQGITAGASPTEPAPATPAPTEAPGSEEAPETSEAVSAR
ncbi:MAG: hypothetical protein JJE35_07570 [Thermoleophilia bacterium]|nr:hypothetical protein [Thermoleophilia bacterium]